MRSRWFWVAAVGVIAVGGLFWGWASIEPLPSIKFADGRSSRVLKVSYGTNHVFSPDPLWKKSLHKVLPQMLGKYLGKFQEYRRATPYDSLAIYLEPLASPKVLVRWRAMTVEAVFPDGTTSATTWNPGSYYPIILGNYPREQKEVLLRFWDAPKSIDMKVPNPHRGQKASWTARPLPQTSEVAGTKVVMKGWKHHARSEPILIERFPGGRAVGWMQWRTRLFDPWGNWNQHESAHPSHYPGTKSETMFKLVAEGTEYISAGFVERPGRDQHEILVPALRTNWGGKLLVLFGPGTYEVSKDCAVSTRRVGLPTTNALDRTGSSWIVRCMEPSLLVVSERPVWEARLRERQLPRKDGRVFAGRRIGSATRGGMTAQLFTPRLPTITTNLEAEVIIRWPPAEFFIEKPN